jgi:hypothetical protein
LQRLIIRGSSETERLSQLDAFTQSTLGNFAAWDQSGLDSEATALDPQVSLGGFLLIMG